MVLLFEDEKMKIDLFNKRLKQKLPNTLVDVVDNIKDFENLDFRKYSCVFLDHDLSRDVMEGNEGSGERAYEFIKDNPDFHGEIIAYSGDAENYQKYVPLENRLGFPQVIIDLAKDDSEIIELISNGERSINPELEDIA